MMLNNEIKTKLRELKISEAIDFLEENMEYKSFKELSFPEQLELLLDYVYAEKKSNRIESYLRGAKFAINNANYESSIYADRDVDIREINLLFSNMYLVENINVVIAGPTGCGKTWLACALGNKACRNLTRTRYIRMQTILDNIKTGKLINRERYYIKQYSNYDLLIIDEWLLTDVTKEDITILYEIIENRVNKPTIICTQYSQSDWILRMDETPISESITSRLTDGSIWINLDGVNMRAIQGEKTLERYHSQN